MSSVLTDDASYLLSPRHTLAQLGTDFGAYAYDALGNRDTMTDRLENSKFQIPVPQYYFLFGRPRRAATGDAGTPALAQPITTMDYTYDLAGNRVSLSSPLALSPAYTYDAATRVIGVNARNEAGKVFEYDALGRLTRIGGGAGSATRLTYDAASQLRTLTHTLPGTELAPFSYTYDLLGNRDTMTDRLGLHAYGYDALSQLTRADHPLASGLVDERFSYDPVGNRLTSHLSASYTHDAANRLLEDDTFTYTYDANGNLTSKTDKTTLQTTTYTYDGENQLIGVSAPGLTAAYRYDGLGRRIEKAVAGVLTRYLYDQEDIVALFTGAGHCQTHAFLHGPGIDQPLAFLRDRDADCAPESLIDLLADGLGTVAALVHASPLPLLVERATADSFGNPRITGPGPDGQLDTADDEILPQSALGNPYLFTGREYDPESGLYYFRARYYDPRLGRFLQEDPVFSANLYPYARNNPTNLIDPDGLNPLAIVAIGAIAGAVIALQNAFIASEGNLSGSQALAAIGVGALAGAGATSAGLALSGVLPVAASAAGFSAAATTAYQSLTGRDLADLNLTSIGAAALIGAAGGAFGASIWLPYTAAQMAGVSPIAQAVASRLAVAGGVSGPLGGLAALLTKTYLVTPRSLGQAFQYCVNELSKK